MNEVSLSEFISNTLVEIAKGIKSANEALIDPDKDVFQVYELRRTVGDSAKTLGIKFDVALSASHGQKDKAGFVIALASLGGAQIQRSKKAMSSSIEFSLRLV